MSIKVLTQTTYAIYGAVIQSYLTACVRLCRYVAKLSMNSTANGSIKSWSCFDQFVNSTAWKIGGTVTLCLIIIVSLAANSLIVVIVYKTPNLRKPINYFIANMASSDLLFPYSRHPLNCHSSTPTCFLSLLSLVRPCVSLSLSLVAFPLSFRFRI